MSDTPLGIYLNDHLAGSVGALEMLDRSIEENAGNSLGRQLEGIRVEIQADQKVLQDLIQRIGSKEHPLKKAGAWLAEKASRVKMAGSHLPEELARMEVLEALTVALQGKLALWRALRAVADRHEALRELDLDLLERRGTEQFTRVEGWRLEAARDVL